MAAGMEDKINVPTPPILVFISDEPTDLDSFASADAALGSLEPPEVTDGLYRLFDSHGYEATLGAKRWEVVITEWSSHARAGELRSLLMPFLSANGIEMESSQPLSQLVLTSVALAQELKGPGGRG